MERLFTMAMQRYARYHKCERRVCQYYSLKSGVRYRYLDDALARVWHRNFRLRTDDRQNAIGDLYETRHISSVFRGLNAAHGDVTGSEMVALTTASLGRKKLVNTKSPNQRRVE